MDTIAAFEQNNETEEIEFKLLNNKLKTYKYCACVFYVYMMCTYRCVCFSVRFYLCVYVRRHDCTFMCKCSTCGCFFLLFMKLLLLNVYRTFKCAS